MVQREGKINDKRKERTEKTQQLHEQIFSADQIIDGSCDECVSPTKKHKRWIMKLKGNIWKILPAVLYNFTINDGGQAALFCVVINCRLFSHYWIFYFPTASTCEKPKKSQVKLCNSSIKTCSFTILVLFYFHCYVATLQFCVVKMFEYPWLPCTT